MQLSEPGYHPVLIDAYISIEQAVFIVPFKESRKDMDIVLPGNFYQALNTWAIRDTLRNIEQLLS